MKKVLFLPALFVLLIISSCKDKEKDVAVESVTIDNGAATNVTTAVVQLNATLTLKAIILPDNATFKEVTWNSSQPLIATVAGGVVTPLKEGETIISATAGGITAKCTVTVLSNFVPLTGISFNPAKVALVINDKKTLIALFTPANASDKAVVWTSDDSNIATVSQSGEVLAKKVGTCKITVKSASFPSIAATCEMEVVAAPISLTGLKAIPADTTLEKGLPFQLRHEVEPVNATAHTEVIYLSSDVTKAIVTETGEVTAKDVTSPGSPVIITVKSQGAPTIMATCRLTIVVRVTSITLSPNAFTLSVGQKRLVEATVMPLGAATNPTVTWKSSDESKATVSNSGEVEALATGEAEITATANDGSGIVGKTTVTVIPVATAITINPAEPAGAVVGVDKTLTLTVSVTPSTASKAVVWESSASGVATVDAATGVVTGRTIGTATITAKATDGSNLSATKMVTVKSSNASLTAMTLGAANHAVTLVEGGTAYLNNAPRTFYSTLTAVPVTITAAAGATVKTGTTDFTSGGNVNFTNPVAFTVTAADGTTTKTYTVGIPAYNATTNPYGVYTAAHLNDVRNDKAASYKMMNDIILPERNEAGKTATGIEDYATAGWLPIAHDASILSDGASVTGGFAGTFDGGNFSIDNLYINRTTVGIGLFGGGSGATIQNLGVIGVTGTAPAVIGFGFVGALAGAIEGGSITNCYASANVSLAGNGSATYCFVGGLLGKSTGTTISKSYSSGKISGNLTSRNVLCAGGFAGGVNGGDVTDCFATGNVTAVSIVVAYGGGFAGAFLPITATNCYATGNVTASGFLGGLLGLSSSSSTYTRCYRNSGAVLTKNGNTIASEEPSTTGITAKTKTEMQSDDFKGLLNGSGNIWGRDANKNDGLPYIIGVWVGK